MPNLVAALLFAIAGCAAAHAPTDAATPIDYGLACGHACGDPCCGGYWCAVGSCWSGGVCWGAACGPDAGLLDTGPPADAGVVDAPEPIDYGFACGHVCEPCCNGDVCIDGSSCDGILCWTGPPCPDR